MGAMIMTLGLAILACACPLSAEEFSRTGINDPTEKSENTLFLEGVQALNNADRELLSLVTSPDPTARVHAMQVMTWNDQPKNRISIRAILHVLQTEKDLDVLYEATARLKEILYAPIESVVLAHRGPSLGEHFTSSTLIGLYRNPTKNEDLYAPLLKELERLLDQEGRGWSAVHENALCVLGTLYYPSLKADIPNLLVKIEQKAMNSPSRSVREAAVWTLRSHQIYDPKSGAAQAIARLASQSSDSNVRALAAGLTQDQAR